MDFTCYVINGSFKSWLVGFMVMNCYTGTPGSGKSLHLARDCMDYLRFGKDVICNFECKKEIIENESKGFLGKLFRGGRKYGKYIFKSNQEITVQYLVSYALKYHKKGVENQTLLAIDECHILFNSRDWNMGDRNKWILFFTEHRKMGYNIILVTPNIRMIDKQIRGVFENEVTHRCINQYKLMWLLPRKTFVAITKWIGNRVKMSTEFFTYTKKCGQFYDSYATLGAFDKMEILEDV